MVNLSIFLGSLVMMFSMKEKYETTKISSVIMLKKLALLINKCMF